MCRWKLPYDGLYMNVRKCLQIHTSTWKLINVTKCILCITCRIFVWCLELLSLTVVVSIKYFVVITHHLHRLQVQKRNSSICYIIKTYNTRHRFPCYWTMNSHILNGIIWYFQLPAHATWVAASFVLLINCTRHLISSVWVLIAIQPSATLNLFLNKA